MCVILSRKFWRQNHKLLQKPTQLFVDNIINIAKTHSIHFQPLSAAFQLHAYACFSVMFQDFI